MASNVVENKKNTRVTFVGHVNHGKSTILGHLLHNINYTTDREIEKTKNWSGIMDENEDEIETGNTHCFKEVEVYHGENIITFIDTPGHKNLIQEMIYGANSADLGLMIMSLKPGDFESGLKGQTMEHLQLLRSFGICNIVVIFNKLDLINWDSQIIEEYKNKFLKKIQPIKFKSVDFCCVSGVTGENLTDEKKGFGPCLIDRIVKYEKREPIQKIEIKGDSLPSIVCKIMILDSFTSIISQGFKCIMHSGSDIFDIEIVKVKVIKKNGETKKIGIAGECALVKILFDTRNKDVYKNIVLRRDDMTIAFGVVNL